MAEFVESPMEPLQNVLDEIGQMPQRQVSEVPKMVDLSGFGQFLQNLKNQGMHPHLMGDFPVENELDIARNPISKPYLVQ